MSMISMLLQGLLSPVFIAEQARTGVAFNPLSQAARRDPQGLYRRLRERDPVHRSSLIDGYVITRYEDVAMLLKDPRCSSSPEHSRRVRSIKRLAARIGVRESSDPIGDTMQRADPPRHEALRGLISRAFTPRTVARLKPRIEGLVDELLGAAERRGAMDIIGDFAHPLTVTVISELLGVPEPDRERFRGWADRAINRRSQRDTAALREYLGPLLQARRREPGGDSDLMGALVAVEEGGRRLSDDEVFSTCGLLFAAGHETTMHLIGNGVLALLEHPDELALLRDDRELATPAVDELLRFCGPVQSITRVATEDIALGERVIRAGEQAMLVIASANRDPERFTDPDRLDIGRSDNRHLAFGTGIHACLGAALARLEVGVALAELARSCPNMRLAGGGLHRLHRLHRLQWNDNPVVRGLRALPVRLR